MSKLFTPMKVFAALLIGYGLIGHYIGTATGSTYMLVGLLAIIAAGITE